MRSQRTCCRRIWTAIRPVTLRGWAKVLIEQLDKEQNATRVAAERETQAQLAEAARVAAEAKQAAELRNIPRRCAGRKRSVYAARDETTSVAGGRRATVRRSRFPLPRLPAQRHVRNRVAYRRSPCATRFTHCNAAAFHAVRAQRVEASWSFCGPSGLSPEYRCAWISHGPAG